MKIGQKSVDSFKFITGINKKIGKAGLRLDISIIIGNTL